MEYKNIRKIIDYSLSKGKVLSEILFFALSQLNEIICCHHMKYETF